MRGSIRWVAQTEIERVELPEGSRVALSAPGSLAYVELVLSLLSVGVFPVPLDPSLTPGEVRRILAPIEPDRHIGSHDEVLALLSGLPERPSGDLPRGRPIHCTSGTTGTPKGVFSGLLDDVEAAALVAEERELWGFEPEDVNLVLSPLHHSAPLRFATGTVLAGGRLVLPGKFNAARATAAIERERPTTMFCVPTHLQRLFAHWDEHGTPDLSSFRLVAHAGAPCPSAVKHRLIDAFPADSIWEFYGSTEGQFTACSASEWIERPGTVGRARPGRTMSTDSEGHLWCTVPSYARFSYLGDEEKTRQAWRDTPDGPAFTVGDVGRIDDAGYVYLDGRRTDLIISGGVNVYPLEVENALRQVDGVEDVAVIGLPDDDWGTRVVAVVVGDPALADLREHARSSLAPAKRPKEYRMVDSLPLTSTGKVRRDVLTDSMR